MFVYNCYNNTCKFARIICARAGRWFTPLHARVPYMQKHLFPSKAGGYCRTYCGETPIAVEGQVTHTHTYIYI